MVESKIHVSRHEHSLFLYNTHRAIQLEDGGTLESYGINENSELRMLAPHLKISIKMPEYGNVYHVDVYDFLTVHDIKKKIWNKMGYTEDRQTLVYCGRSLGDDETLVAYNLQNNSILHAFFGFKFESKELILFIHDKKKGATYQLMAQEWYSVLNIKTLIESMLGIPIGLQELSYLQEDLKDWKTLTHYSIECNSTLCLFVDGHPIEIFIEKSQAKGNDSEIIMLEVKNSDTIDEILAKIPQHYMIGGEILGLNCLFLGETRLKNELNLANYGIKSGTTLFLERSIQVNVGIPSGEVVIVDLKPMDSVAFAKKKIEDLCGVPFQLQTLTYLGDEVDELYTLEDYEIHLGSLQYLRWRFGGKDWLFFWPIYGV